MFMSVVRVLVGLVCLTVAVTVAIFGVQFARHTAVPFTTIVETAAVMSIVFVLGAATRPRPETAKLGGYWTNVDAVPAGIVKAFRWVRNLPARVRAWGDKPAAKPKRKRAAKKAATSPTARRPRQPRTPIPVVDASASDEEDDTDEIPPQALDELKHRFADHIAAVEADAKAAGLLDTEEPGLAPSERLRRRKHNKQLRKAARRQPELVVDDGNDIDNDLVDGSLVGQ